MYASVCVFSSIFNGYDITKGNVSKFQYVLTEFEMVKRVLERKTSSLKIHFKLRCMKRSHTYKNSVNFTLFQIKHYLKIYTAASYKISEILSLLRKLKRTTHY